VEARAVKSLYAAGLLAIVLAALLGAWWLSADVGARQRELRAEPVREAERRGGELARDLRRELERVQQRESRHKPFQYNNLWNDDESPGSGVVLSPLARMPYDDLIAGYFQVDSAGKVTTPAINDQIPEKSDVRNLTLAEHFRDEVARNFAAQIAPPAQPTLVAESKPRKRRVLVPDQPKGGQVVQIDSSSYTMNNASAENYWTQNSMPQQQQAPQQQRVVPKQPPKPTYHYVEVDVPPDPRPKQDIPLVIGPFEWRTYPYAGKPALVAVRRFQTPDGTFMQGFVVDRAQLSGMLATRATGIVAQLHSGDSAANAATEIVPGWFIDIAPDPGALAHAAAAATMVARDFLLRFLAVGGLALFAAAAVVYLVARAERLAKERSKFAAAAAHELRTPLAGLQLYGDMLADGLGDPGKLRDYAKRMSEEASRLGRVVSNVLGFSQLERGNLSVDPQPGELGRALCELAERAQPALDRAGAALELDVPPDLRARFDRDALARIVGNLLDNAEKYGREASDRTIALTARAGDGGIEIVVRDHGPGIAPAARAKLFRPFKRGVTSDGPAGLGLGLALSQSLAAAMGGELAYRSAPDGGAAFVLRLASCA
jgi:signal transduction histidine kinase